jgi:hypothetical protein
MIAHDKLFKLLIGNLPFEFIELFYPQIARRLERSSLIPLDKELLSLLYEDREADLVFQAMLKEEKSRFVFHIEPQSYYELRFHSRMLQYFARVYEKYSLPVYSIAVFSYDTPRKLQPHSVIVSAMNETVLSFKYKTVQLNRMNWRDFVHSNNPVAAALMPRMNIARVERAEVRFQCISLLACTKNLPRDIENIIAKFIDEYLVLSPTELEEYNRMVAEAGKEQRKAILDLTTSWHREGRKEGRQEEAVSLILRLTTKRFGQVPVSIAAQIKTLKVESLEQLADKLLDFPAVEDLSNWLKLHTSGSI